MTTCCGKKRDTRYCSDCGRLLKMPDAAAGAALLVHIDEQLQTLRGKSERNPEDTKLAERVTIWQQWRDWVAVYAGKAKS